MPRAIQPPAGFSIALAVLVLSATLVTSLTVAGLAVAQLRRGGLVVDANKALAAADSGLERALYIDFRQGGLVDPLNSAESPFNTATYKFQVRKTGPVANCAVSGGVCMTNSGCLGGAGDICIWPSATLQSTGTFGAVQRAVEASY